MQMMQLADVEMRHLAALRAVATHGTFASAAKHLGFSQSAVSQQIAALERVIATPVFDRHGGPRPVTLTPAGDLLLGHAVKILDRLETAARDLSRHANGDAGTLTIGTFQSVSVAVLPDIIGRMRRERPDVEIRPVEVTGRDDMSAAVVDGRFDLAFLDTVAEADVDVIPLFQEPYLLIGPNEDGDEDRQDHDHAPAVPVGAIAELGLIGEQDETGCYFRVNQALRAAHVEPRYVFRSGDNGALQALVRSGMGHAIMPLLAIDTTDPGIVCRRIDPPITRAVSIILPTNRTVPAAAHHFVQLASELASAHNAV